MTWAGIALAAALGPAVALSAGERGITLVGAGAVAVGGLAAAAAAFGARATLLFLYVAAVTYNRQYYAFDWLHGDLGSRGLYYTPADLVLAGLLGLWAVDIARGRALVPARRGMAIWLLPWLLVASVSAAASVEPLGSAAEVARLMKLALLLVYLRHNLDRTGIVAILCGLGFMILVQAPISVLHATFGSGQGGLSQLFKQSDPTSLAFRASGTLGHPNFLAPYLLLVVPPFVTLALARPGLDRVRLACFAVTGAGLLSLVLTQSRAPIALMGLALALVLARLVERRALSLKVVLGLFVTGLVLVMAAALPLASRIEQRLTGDFTASVEFRTEYNEAALKMWEEGPLIGIGPNNFSLDLGRYSPLLKQLQDDLTKLVETTGAHLRTSAPVHNVYLLLLLEEGVVGLTAFLLVLGRVLFLAWRAGSRAPNWPGLVGLGLFGGLAAEAVQQLVDYSLMWDALLFTLAVVFAICNRAADADPAR